MALRMTHKAMQPIKHLKYYSDVFKYASEKLIACVFQQFFSLNVSLVTTKHKIDYCSK